jgi:hypothetical protein
LSDAPASPLLAALRTPAVVTTFGVADWEALIVQARRANLLARVAFRLEERGLLACVPTRPRAHFESATTLASAQAGAVRREVEHIVRAVNRTGVDTVLLKGAAYLLAALPAARGRMFADIDVLVPFDRLDEVEAALRLHGWATTHHSDYDQRYYRQWMHELPPLRHVVRTTVVDVHHAILPRTARLKPSSAKLLAASRPLPAGDRLRVLAPIDMVLHSATHLFHNEELGQGLRDLGDLDSLLRHFAALPGFWKALPARAAELDLARPLYYGIHHATRLYGTPVPTPAALEIAKGGPPGALDRVMDALYDRALRPAEDRDPVASLARQALFVRAHWLRMPLPLLVRHLGAKALRTDRNDAAAANRADARL